MNRPGPSGVDNALAKDAVFISPHKFIGGPGTPGILAVKRRLLTNRVPTVPGGGTVSYVSELDHSYIDEPSHREEGGTPAILESIRAGLVFHVKRAVGEGVIEARERDFIERAIAAWSAEPNLHVLGNLSAKRLSIVSFLVRHGELFLHHNFVVALLNDLFGIQARGGCSCAGPYGHRLLGIGLARSDRFRRAIDSGCEGIKPGWVRVNFNYFISERTFQFIIEAVRLIAQEGFRLLCDYRFDPEAGVWRHREAASHETFGLDELRMTASGLECRVPRLEAPESALAGYLDHARAILSEAAARRPNAGNVEPLRPDLEALRWFPLPDDGPG
jgi:hypothetical protein